MTEARITCCVPGCQRSFKGDGKHREVMCGKCFRMAPPALRQDWKLKRRAYFGQRRRRPENRDELELRRLIFELDNLWELIKAEAAAGKNRPDGLDGFLEEMGMR